MEPVGPIDTGGLLAPLCDELVALLRALRPGDWDRPTVAREWRVRDVAAHMLDGDLRVLSLLRDGYREHRAPPGDGDGSLVAFLNQLNAEWIVASRRLSPQVLIDLLAAAGRGAAAVLAQLPPHETAVFPVAWAGEARSENWMHVGREYTERWHHQMQIRDAVGAPGLLERRWLFPLLDLSMRALPHAYRGVAAEPGASVVIEVTGDGGGAWSLVRRDERWQVFRGSDGGTAARIQLDPETTWRSLYHALAPDQARARARCAGDAALTTPFFATRSVMV